MNQPEDESVLDNRNLVQSFGITLCQLKDGSVHFESFTERTHMVRGELMAMDAEAIQFRANHELLRFPRSLVSSLTWLHFQADEILNETRSEDSELTDDSITVENNAAPRSASPSEIGGVPIQSVAQTVQVLVVGDRRLTFDLTAWRDNQLVGQSPALGECAIPLDQIEELQFGLFANQASDVADSDWVARLAPEPRIMAGADGDQRSDMLFGTRSPLIGTELPDLQLAMLDGEPVG